MNIVVEALARARARRERTGFACKLSLLLVVATGFTGSLLAQENPATAISPGAPGGLTPILGDAGPAPEQETVSSYATHNWQTQDGLPHNSVQALALTRDGYLWLGTERGLARFDGVRFTSFDVGPLKDLSGASITALAASKDGVLWIGTRERGLFRWHDGKLASVPLGATNQSVRTFFVASDESLWVGTDAGVASFQRAELQSWLELDDVRSISEDTDGNILFATSAGFRKLKDRQVTRVETTGLSSVRAVTFARNGATWVGGNGGILHLAGDESTLLTRQDGLASGVINTIYEDRHERIWIGTSSGLNYLTDNGAVYEVKHEGGSLDWVYAIYEDREENLWVGARDGLYRLNTKLFTTYTKEHGLVNHNVSSVREDRSRIWIGTWGGGLHFLENGIISRYPIRSQYFNNLVLGLFVDRTGSLWLGTDFEGGLYRRDRDDKVFRYWKEHGVSNLGDPAIRTILLDSQKGRIWVGSRDALNVALRGKQFWRYSTENDLPYNQIAAMCGWEPMAASCFSKMRKYGAIPLRTDCRMTR
jgi:ligand-binding sensor domain-containing protein